MSLNISLLRHLNEVINFASRTTDYLLSRQMNYVNTYLIQTEEALKDAKDTLAELEKQGPDMSSGD